MIWAQEHRIAFEKANLEAHFHFNQCPDCNSRVCDDCFCMDEKEKSGVCKNCGEKNNFDGGKDRRENYYGNSKI